MFDDQSFQRLSETLSPRDDVRTRIKQRVQSRIGMPELSSAVSRVNPAPSFKDRVFARLTNAMHPAAESALQDAAASVQVPSALHLRLRDTVLGRLQPAMATSLAGSGFKWAMALAVFVMAVRSMPFVLLPRTNADIGVQLIPGGADVSIDDGTGWHTLATPVVLKTATSIRSGSSRVTVLLNDDGVLRLEPNTEITLHDLSDHSAYMNHGSTVTLKTGKMWALGLLPPVVNGFVIETDRGWVTLTAGSVGFSQDDKNTTVSVYDRGAIFEQGSHTAFLISGERAVADLQKPFATRSFPTSTFTSEWVASNLSQDAAHRSDIAKLQADRRAEMAGILPTSIFYPAKRLAEEVDVLFAMGSDARTEKRVEQADRRLSEAIALLKDGQTAEAEVPLTEYRDSLIAMAGGTGDNLVRFLVRKQVAEASVSLSPDTASGSENVVRNAVIEVSAAVPNADLNAKDIEGYVLVDKLTDLNRLLEANKDLTGALVAYAEVQPYLQSILATGSGAHPLIQKEATSLLAATSALIKKQVPLIGQTEQVTSVQDDLAQYLPSQPEIAVETEAQLNARIDKMLERIYVFKAPRSRYNQLLTEMQAIKTDPSRGTLLRRLHRALPDGLAGYVSTEIKELGDELNG